jgi:7-cyano-7-deazaguanine reductase
MDTRKEENELHLLGGSTVYKQDYAPEVRMSICLE